MWAGLTRGQYESAATYSWGCVQVNLERVMFSFVSPQCIFIWQLDEFRRYIYLFICPWATILYYYLCLKKFDTEEGSLNLLAHRTRTCGLCFSLYSGSQAIDFKTPVFPRVFWTVPVLRWFSGPSRRVCVATVSPMGMDGVCSEPYRSHPCLKYRKKTNFFKWLFFLVIIIDWEKDRDEAGSGSVQLGYCSNFKLLPIHLAIGQHLLQCRYALLCIP